MQHARFSKFALLCSIPWLLSSCQNGEEIKVYRLAKGKPIEKTTGGSQEPLIPKANLKGAQIAWDKPIHWQEIPGEGMRYVSFLADDDLDISVIFLEGNVGGDFANVNRWRSQISLSPWTVEEFEKNTQVLQTPLGKAKLVDLSEIGHKERVLGALIPYRHGIWFVKMTGDNVKVERQKDSFKNFVKSLGEKS